MPAHLVSTAIAWHVASRLAYVLYVGARLRRQRRDSVLAGSRRAQASFLTFRRNVTILMTNDGASFVALCLASMGTLHTGLPGRVLLVIGAVLAIIGVGTKAWASRSIGQAAYYWEDFFNPNLPRVTPGGPYRFIRNPMYTVGYLHAYGLAVGIASLPGLLAAAFDQAAILIFHVLVERPHSAALERPVNSPTFHSGFTRTS